jgi:hypothetical protein
MHTEPQPHTEAAAPAGMGAVRAAIVAVSALVAAAHLVAYKAWTRPNQTRLALHRQGLRRGGSLYSQRDEQGNVITDNLAWIVFGVLAIVVIGTAISGLGTAVINWVTTQLNLG